MKKEQLEREIAELPPTPLPIRTIPSLPTTTTTLRDTTTSPGKDDKLKKRKQELVKKVKSLKLLQKLSQAQDLSGIPPLSSINWEMIINKSCG